MDIERDHKNLVQTRTKQTEKEYLAEAGRLVKACARQHDVEAKDVDPEMMVRFMMYKSSTVKSSTWRSYRAAVAYMFMSAPERGRSKYSETVCLAAAAKIREINCTSEILEKRTSAKKRKSVSPGDYQKLMEHLSTRRSQYVQFCTLLLQCGLVVGGRPIEWRQGSVVRRVRVVPIDRNEHTLKEYGVNFINAKQTNGRSHGETRTIWLSQSTNKETILAIARWCEIANGMSDKEWELAYNAGNKLVNRCNKELWPNRTTYITFYTVRHQFSADMKASRVSPAVQAAMMGHKVITTAQTHYGLTRNGTPFKPDQLPQADESNVESVTRYMMETGATNDTFNPNDEQTQTKGD